MRLRRFAAFFNLLLAALLMLVVWVLVVWVASRPALKTLIDMTPQHINSVDPLTEELLAELRAQKVEVEFHLFFPPMDGQAQDDATRQSLAIRSRLRDLTKILLVRYRWLGGENVKIKEYDFYGDAASTREAVQAFDYKAAEGEVVVVAVRQPGRERRFVKLSLVSDLGVIDLPATQGPGGPGGRTPVPVLKDFKGEEAISSAIKSLLVQGTPIAYFLKGYSPDIDREDGTATAFGYGGLRAGLSRFGFEVRDFDFRSQPAVPTDATVVIVLEPRRDFTTNDAEALFAYVKRGGRVFVDYSWSAVPDGNPDGGRFGELLGYEVGAKPVFHLIPDVSVRGGGRGLDGNDGVAKLQLQVNSVHPATRKLAQAGRPLEVAAARELHERAGAPSGIRREPLLQSGNQGWLAVTGADGYPDNRAPRIALRSFLVGMAFEVEATAAAGDALGAPPSGTPKTGQVVVISGLFCNNRGVQLFGDLAYNICNWMAERRVLIGIQGASYRAQHLQVQPQQLERAWNLLVYGVPGAFAVLGIVVLLLRRRI
ncbi:MAG: Gldg family protein [Planctomycetota bacterium]